MTPMPTTYIPHATIWPKQSCSATARRSPPPTEARRPMNIVANTMLMRKPGRFRQPPDHSDGRLSPKHVRSASPSAPPTIDDGRYSLRRKGTAVRTALPHTSNRHSAQNDTTAVISAPRNSHWNFGPFVKLS